MIEFAYKTAEFLASKPNDRRSDLEIDVRSWKLTIEKIKHRALAEPAFVLRHLEDGLVRASLLRYLRNQGSGSDLAMRIARMAERREVLPPIRAVFAVADFPHANGWEAAGIEKVNSWLDREHTSGLAHVLLLLLTGRQGIPEAIPRAVDRASRWMDQNPRLDDPLVRWSTIWLAGMVDHQVHHVVQQARTWLRTSAPVDDRLVRISLLWLVGARGDSNQVAEIAVEFSALFENPIYADDSCIRIAWLLWFMRRAAERGVIGSQQLEAAISSTIRWLKKRHDPLVNLAVNLATPFPD